MPWRQTSTHDDFRGESNCAFGNDGTTLYITANHTLCRIKLTTKGQGF